MSVYGRAKSLVTNGLVRLEGITTTNQGLNTYWFKVKDYDVRIWGMKTNNQVIHKRNCVCIRGSLINPKYNTDCVHTLACLYYLMENELSE